jgi:hypothetical protein
MAKLSLLAGALTLVLTALSQVAFATDEQCKKVDADQDVTVTGPGTTTGTITRGGILNGTTSDVFTSGFTPTPDPDTFSYTDTLTITTDQGMLTTSDVGIFDIARGVFSSIARITSGTGIFAGATGTFFISGSTTDGIHFQDRIIGQICLAR